MRRFGVLFSVMLVIVMSFSSGMTGAEGAQVARSYARLGKGRLKSMQWEAWGEVLPGKGKARNVEEACITVATLEPTEGNESTNCGPANEMGFEESVQSPYGTVAAGMYAPKAKRVVVCVKGGRKVNLKLNSVRLHAEGSSLTHSYSYFARGFEAGARVEWVEALDSDGKVVTANSERRRCL